MPSISTLPEYFKDKDFEDKILVIHPGTTGGTIKSRIEAMPEGSLVLFIGDATYTFNSTIAPASYTHMTGLGHVQLDWNGAANGEMFKNAAATDIIYSNLHWVKSGNVYRPMWMYDRDKIWHCKIDDTGDSIFVGGDDCFVGGKSIILCSFQISRYVLGAAVNRFRASSVTFGNTIIFYEAIEAKFTACDLYRLYIGQDSAWIANLDLIFQGCSILSSFAGAPVYITPSGTGTIRNIKFLGCTIEPQNNTRDCIQVANIAGTTIEDILFDGCTLRDANNIYTIPANPTVARWRFNNNRYESIAGTIYNFTDPGDFVYTMDGN